MYISVPKRNIRFILSFYMLASKSRAQYGSKDTYYSLSLSYSEWEVPRELLLHRSKLIPPPVLGNGRFVENKLTSIKRRRMIVQCKEEDVEKNGY